MNMGREIVDLYVDDIIPNRFQPREIFEDKALRELSASIKEHGVIQPIIVRKIGDKYEIIAGERRYKASVMAGLTKIPAIIRNLDDKESSKVALLENLQRRDLTPIEEARTYQKILDLDSMTQEELGRTMGKSQAAIANKLRLLSLADEVQEALLNDKISERHARSLLNIKDKEKQVEMLKKVIANRMTVRELDAEIKKMNQESESKVENSTVSSPEKAEQANTTITTPSENPATPTLEDPFIPHPKVYNPSANAVDIKASSNIDLDELKSKTTDIIGPEKESPDFDKLLQVPKKEEEEDPAWKQNFKFVPNFDEEPEKTTTPEKNESTIPTFDYISLSPDQTSSSNVSSAPAETEKLESISSLPTSVETTTSENTLDHLTMEPSYQEVKTPTAPTPIEIPDEIEMLDDTPKKQSYQPFTNTESLLNEFRNKNGIEHPTAPKEESQPATLKLAINDVRDLINRLEAGGLKIDLDEMDLPNSYQITIKIDK